MLRTIAMGTAAGAVGTVALDVTTYLDMLVRGRSASQVPAQTAEKIAMGAGVSLSSSPAANSTSRPPEERVEARKSALGALLGYVAGLGVGALYGAIRPSLGDAPLPLTGLALGAAAMAAGDLPALLTHSTDPREWGTSGWLSDLVPHMIYGLFTALAYDTFTGGALGRRSTGPADYVAAAMRHSSARLRR